MKKSIMTIALLTLTTTTLLSGCGRPPTEAEQTMKAQNDKKLNQAAHMMNQVQTPDFNRSVERENIRERLIQNNDPTVLQWIYPMSAGRVLGRFPVRGKVTSGSKRLTSTQQINKFTNGNGGVNAVITESPDESGAYGGSDSYIFWFSPAGQFHQFKGDYFLSPVPYKIDIGNGMVTVETDQQEEAKRNTYESQIKQGVKK